ncbi:MAG: hypothetical protein A4S09_12250 [Proteobacteria bacterium SG_bin7]|nr:MAG: hypothetical protein A4S09_12250 [Proteobacteria bacterium SG_bin7]
MKLMLFTLFCFQIALADEVTIIKQWHLSPGVKTIDVEASKKLPQFTNQKNIYLKLAKMLDEKPVTIVSEGCSQEISKEAHYGWSIENLSKKKASADYSDILAFTPVKLKVKYGEKAKIVCADDEVLMKKNLLAFSDLRAFSGFYTRLKQFKDTDKASYKRYEAALFDKEKEKIGKVDALKFAREKALNALAEIENYIENRNKKFVEGVKKTLSENPVLIVGGLHAKGLVTLFEKENIKFSVIVPEGYNEADEKLLESLKLGLQR